MLDLKHGSLEQPGQWERGQGPYPIRIVALVSCPKCGKGMSLSLHTIAADGTVSPSLVCPYQCGFHDFVKLVGWTGG